MEERSVPGSRRTGRAPRRVRRPLRESPRAAIARGVAARAPRPNGASPSGKAAVFGTAIRRFESSRPSQFSGVADRSDFWVAALPTPLSPSIRTGMVDAAARLPSEITRFIASPRMTRSPNVSVPSTFFLMRLISPASASIFKALLIETSSRSGEAGLTTKSTAPRRIALIAVSMEPCAVCTMIGGIPCA